MNSGNRFSCGIKRFDKHKELSDKPTNQQLHNENQKKLEDLIKLRQQQIMEEFSLQNQITHKITN
jgi:hypothetical protein